jgi:hypothetical protein
VRLGSALSRPYPVAVCGLHPSPRPPGPMHPREGSSQTAWVNRARMALMGWSGVTAWLGTEAVAMRMMFFKTADAGAKCPGEGWLSRQWSGVKGGTGPFSGKWLPRRPEPLSRGALL